MISKTVSAGVCVSGFLYTSYIVYKLICFLSYHNQEQKARIRQEKDEDIVSLTLWSLLVDASLLVIFMLQHSVMASDFVKGIYVRLRIEHLSRSVYNTVSSIVLHLLLSEWQAVPWFSVWSIDTVNSNTLWLIFMAFHIVAWMIIYSGCLVMDISDLAGLKQVYYKFSGRPSPMVMKSKELLRYYSHMRHPSFTGFLMILWIHPFMTADRLLLASVLTVYMALMWTIDEEDYNYHASIARRKQRELS